MGRCGVRSADEAAALAGEAGSLEGLVFEGVMGYEGHCVHEPDPAERRAGDVRRDAAARASG